MSRYSPMSQKAALDATIAAMRSGKVWLPAAEREHLADVLGAVRDQIAAWEKYYQDRGRETARELREVMQSDIQRGR